MIGKYVSVKNVWLSKTQIAMAIGNCKLLIVGVISNLMSMLVFYCLYLGNYTQKTITVFTFDFFNLLPWVWCQCQRSKSSLKFWACGVRRLHSMHKMIGNIYRSLFFYVFHSQKLFRRLRNNLIHIAYYRKCISREFQIALQWNFKNK